jgi:16S rRNA (uracil1498-N3)-methyltransferase
MHRFFLAPEAFHGEQVVFPADLARQLRSVLRLQPGQQVWILDGQGHAFRAVLTFVERGKAGARILERQPATGEPAGTLILCQALSKGERFEWVLQKGTELGVTTFQPIITRRTVRKSPGPSRWPRWRRIIREAAEQSGRGALPALLEPIPFDEALRRGTGLRLLPAVSATQPVRQALTGASWPVTLFVGPEGGFAPEEVILARESGVLPVSLGPRVLRTETAALALVTLTMAALGELDKSASRM